MNENQPTPVVYDARSQVSSPSVGLLVTGIIGAVSSLAGLFTFGIGLGLSSFWLDEIPEDFADLYEGAFAIGSSFVGLLVAGFIIFAALKMKDLEQWGLAVAASVLAMIPCISPCCIVGLPIGIWCLTVLMRPEVKDAFK
jgi:hypothetical protein